jgi:hypothetical protein
MNGDIAKADDTVKTRDHSVSLIQKCWTGQEASQ